MIINIQSATSYKHVVQNSRSTFRALSVIARNNALMSSQNSFNNFFLKMKFKPVNETMCMWLIIPQEPSTLFSKAGSLMDLEPVKQSRIAGQEPQRLTCLYLPRTSQCHHTRPLTQVLGTDSGLHDCTSILSTVRAISPVLKQHLRMKHSNHLKLY